VVRFHVLVPRGWADAMSFTLEAPPFADVLDGTSPSLLE
jgi:hypothetical protein